MSKIEQGQEHQASLKQDKKRMVSKILRSSPAAFVLGAALATGAVGLDEIRSVVEPPPRIPESQQLEAESPRGKYLHLELEALPPLDGTPGYSIRNINFSHEPQVLSVGEYNVLYDEDPSGPSYEGNIVLRRSTKRSTYQEEMSNAAVEYNEANGFPSLGLNFDRRVLLKPEEIKTKFVVPVFGDSLVKPWAEGSNVGYIYDVDLHYNGVAVNGGVWFALADENGNYVDPQGEKIRENEKPYYAEAPFIHLAENSATTQEKPQEQY